MACKTRKARHSPIGATHQRQAAGYQQEHAVEDDDADHPLSISGAIFRGLFSKIRGRKSTRTMADIVAVFIHDCLQMLTGWLAEGRQNRGPFDCAAPENTLRCGPQV
jgi:hypothetical protein